MREVEVKILNVNFRRTVARLRRAGARKIFDGHIHALYFDFKNKFLKKQRCVLRLRQKGDKIEFAFKKTRGKNKARIMDEFETHVDDFATTQKILNRLQLRVVREIKKHRISYALGDIRFELDKIRGIPLFLEIEAPSVKKLMKILKKLGYSLKETRSWSNFDLVRFYGR